MSYEGYEVWYCPKGHRVGVLGSLCFLSDEEAEKFALCKVCGEKAITSDSVDETNGCYCDSMTEEDVAKHGKCPAHESVETIARYDPVPCPYCQGSGRKEITVVWRWEKCKDCTDVPFVCSTCKGRTVIPVPAETQLVHCSCCHGSGAVYVEAYDISHLLERDRKSRERDEKLKEQYYMTVSAKQAQEQGKWEVILEEFDVLKGIEEELLQEDCKFTLSKEQAQRLGFVEESE